MTHKTNRYGIYEVDHTKFGGIIYPSDYNTNNIGKNNYNGSPIVARIARDENFDRQCRNNMESIERNKNYGK